MLILSAGAEVGSVESVTAGGYNYTPSAGTPTAVNEDLKRSPALRENPNSTTPIHILYILLQSV